MGELNFGRMLRQTRRHGDATAFIDLGDGHTATYTEHLDRIGRLSAVIADLGVESGDRLAVLAGGSHVYAELWHACLAGAAVINPLNTRLTADDLAYILEDSASVAIFVDATYAPVIAAIRDRLPALRTIVLIGDGDVVCDHRIEDLMAASTRTDLPPEPDPDAPAVLMYTGGTTGLPKGVVLSQRAVVLSIYRMQPVVDLGGPQTYLAFMPMFHIGGIASWGLYLPAGGSVVVLPAFEPAAVNAAIQDHGVTSIGAVPTMLAFMIQHPDFDPSMFATLELIMYGAAPMPPTLLANLMEMRPDLAFHQAYGMTEICAIACGLTRGDHRIGGEILASVGRPCLGVDLELRDPITGESTPQGEVGEIWLRADSVMLEYWNKAEQTAASIVDGWYRSGDAARLDPAGYVYMADRVKDMIVSGGENVYSIEVENVIAAHPGVRAVAVVGVTDETWGERVHAVVVCAPGAVSEAELTRHARASLAGYKVPKSWTLQAEPLPLSAAGKVLKRELRDRFASS